MAWYDVGAVLLLIVASLAGVALLVGLGALIYFVVRSTLESRRPIPPPLFAETSIGRFAKCAERWEFVGKAPIDITVRDVDGNPDAEFVSVLPGLLQNLPQIERKAREAYDFRSDEEEHEMAEPFVLDGLSQESEGFTLIFNAEGDSSIAGTVFVEFIDGEVVGATLVD